MADKISSNLAQQPGIGGQVGTPISSLAPAAAPQTQAQDEGRSFGSELGDVGVSAANAALLGLPEAVAGGTKGGELANKILLGLPENIINSLGGREKVLQRIQEAKGSTGGAIGTGIGNAASAIPMMFIPGLAEGGIASIAAKNALAGAGEQALRSGLSDDPNAATNIASAGLLGGVGGGAGAALGKLGKAIKYAAPAEEGGIAGKIANWGNKENVSGTLSNLGGSEMATEMQKSGLSSKELANYIDSIKSKGITPKQFIQNTENEWAQMADNVNGAGFKPADMFMTGSKYYSKELASPDSAYSQLLKLTKGNNNADYVTDYITSLSTPDKDMRFTRESLDNLIENMRGVRQKMSETPQPEGAIAIQDANLNAAIELKRIYDKTVTENFGSGPNMMKDWGFRTILNRNIQAGESMSPAAGREPMSLNVGRFIGGPLARTAMGGLGSPIRAGIGSSAARAMEGGLGAAVNRAQSAIPSSNVLAKVLGPMAATAGGNTSDVVNAGAGEKPGTPMGAAFTPQTMGQISYQAQSDPAARSSFSNALDSGINKLFRMAYPSLTDKEGNPGKTELAQSMYARLRDTAYNQIINPQTGQINYAKAARLLYPNDKESQQRYLAVVLPGQAAAANIPGAGLQYSNPLGLPIGNLMRTYATPSHGADYLNLKNAVVGASGGSADVAKQFDRVMNNMLMSPSAKKAWINSIIARGTPEAVQGSQIIPGGTK